MVAGISPVSICNNALIKINADTIESLEDVSKEGKTCNILYPQLRDKVLQAHPWNFALKQAQLAQLTDEPLFEFAFAYQLPADCLRVFKNREWLTARFAYKIKGRQLHTDAGSATIEYIFQQEDTTQFSPMFVDLLALQLAANLAYNIAGSNSLKQLLLQEYVSALAETKRRDGQEGIPDPMTADLFVDSRYIYSPSGYGGYY